VSCSHTPVRSSSVKKWMCLNRFKSRTDYVLRSVRIGMGCMNIVIVIAPHIRVPVSIRKCTV